MGNEQTKSSSSSLGKRKSSKTKESKRKKWKPTPVEMESKFTPLKWEQRIDVLKGDESQWLECFRIIGLRETFYPKPHQLQGVRFMMESEEQYRGSILADEMGLGKTLQVHLLVRLRALQQGTSLPEQQTLIVTPRSVSDPCVVESLKYFEPHARPRIAQYKKKDIWYLYVHGQDKPQKVHSLKLEEFQSFDLIVTHHEALTSLARLDPEHFLLTHSYKRVVIDEAHKLRNSDTHLSRVCSNLKADYRLCVTGTPKINSDADLWSLFQFLRIPGLMPLQEFKKYASISTLSRSPSAPVSLESKSTMGSASGSASASASSIDAHESNSSRTQLSFMEQLYRLYMHRVTKQDIREQEMERVMASCPVSLPSWCTPREYKHEILIEPPSRTLPVGAYEREIILNPSTAMKNLYECLLHQERKRLQTLDESEHRTSVLALLSYLRQMTLCPHSFFSDLQHRLKITSLCGAERIDAVLQEPSSKLTAIEEYIQKNMQPNEKALIFVEFRKACQNIVKMLQEKGERCIEINGNTTDDVRKKTVRAFQAGTEESLMADNPRFMVSTMCMYEGVTLTEANHVLFVSPWWHSAMEKQAWCRAHRMGQERDVHVVYFLLDQTIDLRVREISKIKTGVPSTKQLLHLIS